MWNNLEVVKWRQQRKFLPDRTPPTNKQARKSLIFRTSNNHRTAPQRGVTEHKKTKTEAYVVITAEEANRYAHVTKYHCQINHFLSRKLACTLHTLTSGRNHAKASRFCKIIYLPANFYAVCLVSFGLNISFVNTPTLQNRDFSTNCHWQV